MEQMKLASVRGLPPMRPLFFDYPEDTECYKIEDEYLFGPDIVVAPVYKKDMREREVYLPSLELWFNAWTGEKEPAGRWFSTEAPIDRIPVFLKDRNFKFL